MINMTHGPNIHMRLVPLELLFTHGRCDSNVVVVGWMWVVKELMCEVDSGRSLAADPLHDFFGDGRRHLLVLGELHRVRGTPLCA